MNEDFLNNSNKTYEIEIIWEQDISDEEDMFGHYIEGGKCLCGHLVESTDNFCSHCGKKLKFVPFKPIKTDLTLKQYEFLKKFTGLDKFQIASTTKAEAIKIIGEIKKRWEDQRNTFYDEIQEMGWDIEPDFDLPNGGF